MSVGSYSVSTRDHRFVARGRADGELLTCFLVCRDDVAFAALVTRYAGMVLAVCGRVLHHRQDAEDARQATFLTLMRKASSLHEKEELGSWLCAAAYREALNVRKRKKRRQEHEQRCERCQSSQPNGEVELGELQTLVDEAVQRLPEKYHLPFVLCCLDGESKAVAARKLGWKKGTLSRRLAWARQFVQRELRRRGFAP